MSNSTLLPQSTPSEQMCFERLLQGQLNFDLSGKRKQKQVRKPQQVVLAPIAPLPVVPPQTKTPEQIKSETLMVRLESHPELGTEGAFRVPAKTINWNMVFGIVKSVGAWLVGRILQL